jgi:hypothetical protein
MYKIIYEDKVIDIVQHPRFLRFLSFNRIAFTDKSSAQGILGSDRKTIYTFSARNYPEAKVVSIKKISEEEFNRLQSLLNSGYEISANLDSLDKVKHDKIAELSEICKDKITSGFNIVLKDGNSYNFTLTAEDQINILNLENQLNSDAKVFIYHTSGCPCRAFVRDDVIKIVNTYRQHVLYHTTYFNVAKQYINSLTGIDTIKAFQYGDDIISTVKDSFVKQVLKSRGVTR